MHKIVNFISGRKLAGSEQVSIDYIDILNNAKFETYSIVRSNSSLLKILKNKNYKNIYTIKLYPNIPLFKKHPIKKMQNLINKINPSCIIAHKQKDLLFIKRACPSTPLIYVAHSFEVRLKYIEMADYILAVSNSVKKFLTQFQLKTQIDVLNPCIDIKYEGIYKPIGSKIVIGTMAVIRRKKNIKCLLQAFALLKKREVPFQGIIAGRGYSILWLKLLSKKYNISDNIIFKPWVTDKEKFFNEIDIYCVTSNKETFNISLIEAMAHKKYVISTKCGGPEEIIVQNKTGYLIPINDYTELAKHIEFLRGNPDKMARSVINGYNRVTDLYNFDTCVIKLKKYINSLINLNK